MEDQPLCDLKTNMSTCMA